MTSRESAVFPVDFSFDQTALMAAHRVTLALADLDDVGSVRKALAVLESTGGIDAQVATTWTLVGLNMAVSESLDRHSDAHGKVASAAIEATRELDESRLDSIVQAAVAGFPGVRDFTVEGMREVLGVALRRTDSSLSVEPVMALLMAGAMVCTVASEMGGGDVRNRVGRWFGSLEEVRKLAVRDRESS